MKLSKMNGYVNSSKEFKYMFKLQISHKLKQQLNTH